jgi:hypothetical protein
MDTEEITIRVDREAATAYRGASEDDRQKLDTLLNLRLHEALRVEGSLREVMQRISQRATERGLTPDELKTILDDF